MECRNGCGACCIAPSITTPMPGMPDGKPAGVRCVNLDTDLRCKLFNDARRPDFCKTLQPEPQMCGENAEQALHFLTRLDLLTR